MRFLLYPFSFIYYIITIVRNLLYDYQIFKSKNHKIPIICVGNLSVGGTGKTPHTDYITKLLEKKYNLAIISRGYGRRSSGFKYVKLNSKPLDIGDEPLMLKNKNPNTIVAVNSNRNQAVEKIINDYPEINLIILDDGYQHRKIQASVYILITPFHNLFYNDNILPFGTLRESKKESKRADIILISNSPNKISDTTKNNIIKSINPKKHQSIYFSGVKYLNYKSLKDNSELKKEEYKDYSITLVTGIASNTKLLEYVKKQHDSIKILSFSDHYNYNEQDIHKILSYHMKHKNRKKLILTTEKDATKLKQFLSIIGNNKIYYLGIEISIYKNEKFNKNLKNYVREN